MIKFCLILTSLIVLSSCKTSSDYTDVDTRIIKNNSKNITFINKDFTTNYQTLFNEIQVNSKYKVDAIAQEVLKNSINKSSVNGNSLVFTKSINCISDVERAKIQVIKNLKDHKFFDYELVSNTATGTRLHPSIKREFSIIKQDITSATFRIKNQYIIDYGSISTPSVGKGEIDIVVEWACDQINNKINMSLRLINGKTANPIVDLIVTQDMAKIFMLNDAMETFMAPVITLHDNKKSYLALKEKLVNKLTNRYKYSNKMASIDEFQVNLAPKIVLSRIQRSLVKELIYKKDVVVFLKDHQFMFNGSYQKSKTQFKIFPEINNSSRILVTTNYTEIVDTFSKETIFSINEAKNVSNNIIEIFKNTLDTEIKAF